MRLYRVLIILYLIMISQLLISQQMIPLWDEIIPFNRDGIAVEEINENYRVSRVSVPGIFRFAACEMAVKQKPAIIIVPGGGYARQATNHEGVMVAKWFASRGYEAFVLKYRLPDEEIVENPAFAPLIDLQQAIHHVRSNADKYGVDAAKIGVIGFSAGGHLAGSASVMFDVPVNKNLKTEDVRPDFSILVYPVISMDDEITHRGSKINLLGENPMSVFVELFSLEKQASSEVPVTLLVHSMDDRAVPLENSLRYADALSEKGVDVTQLILPFGGHGYGFRENSGVEYWIEYLDVWLKNKID
ncbi:alpha/beta hydrolase [Alkalitalea saponilacus]|uniref:Acetyl esterase/lipase n=1 Tax=Alkalitalea saponilacus TaxID=889453 RepID=A0A1T5AJJ7_9BACT|nr:alpha/beta hydrolase [Alkalitalea saponilacus]SKB35171.1 Acetyl esterase/lipase [Alkalitalea saponilacus]